MPDAFALFRIINVSVFAFLVAVLSTFVWAFHAFPYASKADPEEIVPERIPSEHGGFLKIMRGFTCYHRDGRVGSQWAVPLKGLIFGSLYSLLSIGVLFFVMYIILLAIDRLTVTFHINNLSLYSYVISLSITLTIILPVAFAKSANLPGKSISQEFDYPFSPIVMCGMISLYTIIVILKICNINIVNAVEENLKLTLPIFMIGLFSLPLITISFLATLMDKSFRKPAPPQMRTWIIMWIHWSMGAAACLILVFFAK